MLLANAIHTHFYYPLAIKGQNDIGYQVGVDIASDFIGPFKWRAGASLFHIEKPEFQSTSLGYMALINYPYSFGFPIHAEWGIGVAGNAYSKMGVVGTVALQYPVGNVVFSGTMSVNTNQDVMMGLGIGWRQPSASALFTTLFSPPEPRSPDPLVTSVPVISRANQTDDTFLSQSKDPLASNPDRSPSMFRPMPSSIESVSETPSVGPTDIRSHWAKDEISWALSRGYLTSGGLFFPSAVLSGNMAMGTLSKLAAVLGKPLTGLPKWTNRPTIFKKELAVALLTLINSFRSVSQPQSPEAIQLQAVRLKIPPQWLASSPTDKPLTRAEAAVMIDRILKSAGLQ